MPALTRHAKAASFNHNDRVLDVLRIGVAVFPGAGIQNMIVPMKTCTYKEYDPFNRSQLLGDDKYDVTIVEQNQRSFL